MQFLNRMPKEGFSGKETFDTKLEGGTAVNHLDVCGNGIPGRRISS